MRPQSSSALLSAALFLVACGGPSGSVQNGGDPDGPPPITRENANDAIRTLVRMDPEDLRLMFEAQEPDLLPVLRQSALAGAAYTYRSFSDEDVAAYVEALEEPEMIEVYELLNAVQYEIMANRFEVLAGRMTELHPGQDI